MLRLSEYLSSAGITTLRLEGRLTGLWIEEVSRSCEFYAGSGRHLNLDLKELSFVDREGIALLKTLAKRGVGFINCSPFLERAIEGGV